MKKGFTLIELLAVIVILAIILVIAVPQIFKVIEDARKATFISTTKNLMSALEKTSMSMIRENEYKDIFVMYEGGIKTIYPTNAIIDYKGTNPQSGGIVLRKDGNVVLSLYNGKYCVSKLINSEEILVEEINETECVNKIIFKQAAAPFNNYLTNGDFSNGTNGWSFSNAGSPTVENGIISFLPTAIPTSTTSTQHVYQMIPLVLNNIYYVSSLVYGDTSVYLRTTTYAPGQVTIPYEWQTLSNNFTATVSAPRAFGIRDSKTADWTETKFTNAIFINLTETFGIGNEPTKVSMDNNLNKVWIDTSTSDTPKKFTPVGWFNF